MNTATDGAAPKNLHEALEQTGHLWWVEQRLNAVDESAATEEGFIIGLKNGLFDQINAWSARDKSLQYFGNRPAVGRLVDDYLHEKFNPALNGEPIADETGEEPLEDEDDQ